MCGRTASASCATAAAAAITPLIADRLQAYFAVWPPPTAALIADWEVERPRRCGRRRDGAERATKNHQCHQMCERPTIPWIYRLVWCASSTHAPPFCEMWTNKRQCPLGHERRRRTTGVRRCQSSRTRIDLANNSSGVADGRSLADPIQQLTAAEHDPE